MLLITLFFSFLISAPRAFAADEHITVSASPLPESQPDIAFTSPAWEGIAPAKDPELKPRRTSQGQE